MLTGFALLVAHATIWPSGPSPTVLRAYWAGILARRSRDFRDEGRDRPIFRRRVSTRRATTALLYPAVEILELINNDRPRVKLRRLEPLCAQSRL